MSENRVFSASASSVEKALDLLRSRSTNQGAKVKKNISVKKNQIAAHCSNSRHSNIFNKTRRKVSASGFSRSYATNEMRKCLMQHKWAYMTKIFPLLLDGRTETEPLLWKYIFIQLLYSPKANMETLNHFLQMCVGCRSLEFLQQVLTLTATCSDAESTDSE